MIRANRSTLRARSVRFRLSLVRVPLWCLLLAGFVFSMSPTAAQEPREPGLNELVIMRPGLHEKGLPPVRYDEDTQQVEIPPALHVHRFYYSGDKEYQGPILQGGPTVVVARHPYSGEQVNVDVMLPGGAPMIAYNRKSITYIYPKQRVIVLFSRLRPKHIKVSVVSGRGLGRKVRDTTHKLVGHKQRVLSGSSLATSLKEAITARKDVVVGAVDLSQSAAGFVVDKSTQALNIIPGVQRLRSMGERSAAESSRERVRQASLKKTESARQFIRTNR